MLVSVSVRVSVGVSASVSASASVSERVCDALAQVRESDMQEVRTRAGKEGERGTCIVLSAA